MIWPVAGSVALVVTMVAFAIGQHRAFGEARGPMPFVLGVVAGVVSAVCIAAYPALAPYIIDLGGK